MVRLYTIKPYGVFIICLVIFCLVLSFTKSRNRNCENQSVLSWNAPITPTAGDWSNIQDPFHLDLNTYYTLPSDSAICYATFSVRAREIYFIYLSSPLFWDSELYNNSDYTGLLGTPYSLPYSMVYYMIFSPNHTGNYYLKLYSTYGIGKLAVLTALSYTINTSRLIIISSETHPLELLQIELLQGNYSASSKATYAKVERGWNYVVLPEMYGVFDSKVIPLTNGSYLIIIEESSNFCLTGYVPSLRNETPALSPLPANNSDTGQGNSILNGVTPLFGVGVIVGLYVLYKFKKK